MKILGNILAAFIVVFLVFMVGVYCGESRGEYNTENVKKQADGVLAYKHYFEASEAILTDIDMVNIEHEKVMNLETAKKQLDDYLSNHALVLPEVCEQRDKLSDAIRKYHDDHLQFDGDKNNDIIEYVEYMGVDPNLLPKWSYSY